MLDSEVLDFPDGFRWGVATASYQIGCFSRTTCCTNDGSLNPAGASLFSGAMVPVRKTPLT